MGRFFLSSFLLITVSVTSQEYIKNRLVVKLSEPTYREAVVNLPENKLGIQSLDSINNALHISAIQSIGRHQATRTFVMIFANPIDVASTLDFYRKTGLIDFVEPDYIAIGGGQRQDEDMVQIPNDTYFFRQWGFVNSGTLTGVGATVGDADVDMDQAWDIETGDPGLIIAISDSGLKLNHPDIASRIWTNTAETVNGIDDDGNGYVDDIYGWDWANNDSNPTDDLGHGTNIAGIIGAIPNNASLYTGANWNSKIMVLKTLNSANSATTSGMANSVYYAADKGAKVFSMSIGGGFTNTMQNAVSYANNANMLIVACMMNFNNATPYYPAAYSLTFPNVIAVGSTNPDDSRTAPFSWSPTSGSNYGTHLNVVAPGNYIYGLEYTSDTYAHSYWGGTSQATPLVAAIASLLLSFEPDLTPSEVRNLLQISAQDGVGTPLEDVPGFDVYMGYGRANAHTALLILQDMLGVKEFSDAAQELSIVNPEQHGNLQVFSKGNHIGHFTVSVSDMQGRLINISDVKISDGTNSIPFDYPIGTYIVQLNTDGYSKRFKVLKK